MKSRKFYDPTYTTSAISVKAAMCPMARGPVSDPQGIEQTAKS